MARFFFYEIGTERHALNLERVVQVRFFGKQSDRTFGAEVTVDGLGYHVILERDAAIELEKALADAPTPRSRKKVAVPKSFGEVTDQTADASGPEADAK